MTARAAAVVVSPYSDAWPGCFLAVRNDLLAVFAPATLAIEHVGSTSVRGLAAKPVIDVLLGARSLVDVESRIRELGEHGYSYVQKYEQEFPMRRYFVKPASTTPRVHLHAVELGSLFWQEQLAFRDALRVDSELCLRYQSLKLRLAEDFAADKSAYTTAKGPFIRSVLARLGGQGEPGRPDNSRN